MKNIPVFSGHVLGVDKLRMKSAGGRNFKSIEYCSDSDVLQTDVLPTGDILIVEGHLVIYIYLNIY